MKYILQGHTLLTWSMVCNRSWHLPGNPKQVWQPAHLIKGGSGDLSMDTMHLKEPLILFGAEGSALSITLFHLLLRIINFVKVLQQ